MIIKRVILLATAFCLMAVPSAAAHFTVAKHGNYWYFDVQTYGNDQATPESLLDPVSLAFFRSTTLPASQPNIDSAFAQNWSGPGHMSSTAKCGALSGKQWMKFRSFKRYNGTDGRVIAVRDFQELNGGAYPAAPVRA